VKIYTDDAGITGDMAKKCLEELSSQDLQYKDAKEQTLNLFNKNYINSLLSANNGNVTQAAKICGLERQALQQIMRRYGISAEDFR
jgi:DNA-binding NtrC family response regulator